MSNFRLCQQSQQVIFFLKSIKGIKCLIFKVFCSILFRLGLFQRTYLGSDIKKPYRDLNNATLGNLNNSLSTFKIGLSELLTRDPQEAPSIECYNEKRYIINHLLTSGFGKGFWKRERITWSNDYLILVAYIYWNRRERWNGRLGVISSGGLES